MNETKETKFVNFTLSFVCKADEKEEIEELLMNAVDIIGDLNFLYGKFLSVHPTRVPKDYDPDFDGPKEGI